MDRRRFLQGAAAFGAAAAAGACRLGAPAAGQDLVERRVGASVVQPWEPAVGYAEQLYKRWNIGPGDAPEPEPLPGSYREVRNFSQLQRALDDASAGETIVLRAPDPFTIYQGSLDLNTSGASGGPIIIRKHPDDEGQAILFNGWMDFVEPDNSAWELHDADKHIWRSVASDFTERRWITGFLFDEDRQEFLWLFPYRHEHLSASGFGMGGYRGPGVSFSGGCIYIRLQDPDPDQAQGDFVPVADKDPRMHRIFVGDQQNGHRIRASHLRLWDLTWLAASERMFHYTGTITDIRWLRCNWHIHCKGITNRAREITDHWIEYCAIRKHMGQWIPRADHKSNPDNYRRRTDSFAFGGGGGVNGFHVRHCRITDFFDIMRFAGGPASQNLSIKNCYLRSIDDVTQNRSNCHNMEWSYNHVVGAGFSHQGTRDELPVTPPLAFQHHNVMDARWKILWSHGGPRVPRALAQTHSGYGDGCPWAVYNNTWIGGGAGGTKRANQGVRINYLNRNQHNKTGVPHYVFNNIVVQTSYNGPMSAMIDARVADASQIFDGNLWWHNDPGGEPIWSLRWSRSDQTTRNFEGLATFKASMWVYETKSYYAPGWESKGAEGDPEFVDFDAGNFQPAAGGLAATHRVVDLTRIPDAADWPENDSPFVGAIPPAGT